jgi:hypothetical protein
VPYVHKGKGLDGLINTPTDTGSDYTATDYASNLTAETAKNLLSDNRFLKDLYDYYGQRDGKSFRGAEEVVEYYLNDRRWKNNNSISIGKDVYDAYNSSDAQTKRLARIQQVYDQLPFGVDGAGEAILETGAAMLADPLNLIGFGAGGQAARLAAGTAAKGLTKSQISQKAMGAAIKSGATGEAVASGITEGIADIGIQNRNVGLGLQDDVSLLRAGGAALGGAATGGALGGVFGLGGAVTPNIPGASKVPFLGKMLSDTNARKAGNKGITQLDDEGIKQLSDKVGSNLNRNSITRGMADRAANAAGRVTPEGNLQLQPTPRTNMLEDENPVIDFNEAGEAEVLAKLKSKTEEELDTQRKDRQSLIDEGDAEGAEKAERGPINAVQRKLQRIDFVSRWPQTREQNQVAIDAETAKLQAAGQTTSPELERLQKAQRDGENGYQDFVGRARSQLSAGDSMAASRIDDIFDQPNELLDRAIDGEGFTVSPATETPAARVELDEPKGADVEGQQFRPTPNEETIADAASPVAEEAAPEADVTLSAQERLDQNNQRLDGRKKGSIAYERKRLEREMANMPETLEDGSPNPELLTLQKRVTDIDNEAVALKEEQQSLTNQIAEEQKQSTDAVTNPNQEAVSTPEGTAEASAETAPTPAPEPVIDVETQINEFIDVEFSPTLSNIRREFNSLGLSKEKSSAIIGAMPKGKGTEAVEARRAIFRDTVNIIRGEQEWNSILNRTQSDNGIGDELFDEEIADALIESIVGDAIQPQAKQAHREWRNRSVGRYAMDLENEFMGLATIEDMLEVVKNRHGEGEFYNLVSEFWANAQKGILPSPDDGDFMPRFVQEQIATLPKEMQTEWTGFKEASIRNLMKSGKLNRETAIKLVRTQADAMLDRFLQQQKYMATDPMGNQYSVRQLATRTTSAIDIDEKAIKEGHGEHIGRVQQNLRNVTMGNGRAGSGRDVSDKTVGRVQSFLRQSPQGYGGKTFTKIRTVRDGKTFIYDSSESANRLNEEAMIERNKSFARAKDEVLRDRSIEAAERAKDQGLNNVLDPRDLEEIQNEIRLAEGAVSRAQKSFDQSVNEGVSSEDPAFADAVREGRDVPNEGEADASSKLKAAQTRLTEALERAKAVTGGDATDPDIIKSNLKDLYDPLVYTDRGTVVANRVEKSRATGLRRYYELEARIAGIHQDLKRAERKGDAKAAVALKQERAKLNKRKSEMLNTMSPSDKKRIKADDTNAAVQALGRLKRELRKTEANDLETKSQVPESELIREAEDVFNVQLTEEELSRAEYYANMEELAELSYQEMQGELAHLQEHSAGMPKEEVRSSAKQIVSTAQEKIQSTKPDSRPKGEPEAHIVQIGKRAYNMAKDVQYQKIEGGSTKFFVNGKELGSIREFSDENGIKVFQIIRRNGDKVSSDMAMSRTELYKKIAQASKKELDEVLSSGNVPEERSIATSPTEIPDYHNTQRYADVEDAPLQAQSSDPITVADDVKPQDRGIKQESMPDGKLVSIQIIDPKHPDFGKNRGVRVINQTSKKGSAPQTSSAQLSGGLKPNQYVVGSVNSMDAQGSPVKSGSVAAAKTFRPLNPDEDFISLDGQRLTGRQAGETESLISAEDAALPNSPRARENRAVNVNELDNIPLNRETMSPELNQSGLPDSIKTAGDLQRFIADMEDVEWNKFDTIEQFDQFVASLRAGYETLATYAPNGVKLPNQKRSQSYKQLGQILSGKDQKEISEILSIFNLIAGSENRQSAMLESAMPVFDSSKTYGFKQPGRHMSKDKQSNSVLIGTSNKQTDAMNFSHEMAHWAYQNMLTPSERLEFWDIARGYMTSEGADSAALKRRLPGISSGEIRSPSEFFANQFAIYVANRRQSVQGSLLERLFKDVGRKAESIVRRLLGMDNPLDEQLVDMFERIMPDPKVSVDGVSAGRPLKNQFEQILVSSNGKKSGAARMAAQQLHDLREIQIEIEEALRVGGAIGYDARIMADVLERASKKIYGKFGGRPGQRSHSTRTDINGNSVEGGKRVTMLDSYDKGGSPVYNAGAEDIVLPNGKTVKPFKYMSSRIARGRMLGMSYKIMRMLNDADFTNALSKIEASDLTGKELDDELSRLIATQQDGGMMTISDEVAAFSSDNSGTLASSFEAEASILRAISEKTDSDGKLSALMVQQANDMVVALDMGIDEFVRIYNTNFRSTNGVAPNITKAGQVYKSGNKTTQKYVKRVEQKAKDLALKVANAIDTAEDQVFGQASAIESDPVVSRDIKGMSNKEVMVRINDIKGADTPEMRELKQELYHRVTASLDDPEFAYELTPTTAKFLSDVMKLAGDMPAEKQFTIDTFYKAVDLGDYELAENAIRYLGQLRSEPGEGLPVRHSLVGRAIDIEAGQRSKADQHNGVPGDAPAAIKEVLTKLTHRDKKVEYTSRTMLYRMLNLMGRTATELVRDKTTFMTGEDLFKLSGEPMPVGSKAVFAESATLSGEPFNATRKQLRQFAIGITSGNADPVDVMHEIGHMVSRATFDDVDRDHMISGFVQAVESGDKAALEIQSRYGKIEGYSEKDIAEEWFVEGWGQWMAKKVAKGDIYNIRFGDGNVSELTVKGYLSQLADRLYESTAYVLNGLIGRKTIRQQYRQMLYHGDMFSSKRSSSPIKTVVNANQFPAVNHSMARSYVQQVVKGMSNEKKLMLREFLGAGPDEDLADYVEFHGTPVLDQFDRVRNPDTYLIPSDDGMFGPGVYTTKNQEYAGGYADRTAPDAYRNMARGLEGEKAETAENIIKQIEILEEQFQDAQLLDGPESYTRAAHFSAKLEAATEAFARLTNNKKSPGVLPMFVRKKNHIDLRTNKRFDFASGEPSDVSSMLASAQRRGYINQSQAEDIANFMGGDGISGDEFYDIMVSAMGDKNADGFRYIKPDLEPEGRANFSRFLRDEGYEGIISNSLPGTNFEETITFNPNHMKHIEADFFDSDRRGMYYSVLGDEGTSGLAGDAVQALAIREKPIDLNDMVGVARQLQEAGMPDLLNPIRRMVRKEMPTEGDVETVKKTSTVFGYFRENSQKLRESGAAWLGDFIKPAGGTGIYERHDVDLSDKVMPIMNALKQLPDNKNWATRWSRKSLAFLPDKYTGSVGLQEMPASHQRILGAIRRGESEVRKLDAQEQTAARLIISEFEAERVRMTELGIPVGDSRRGAGDYYVPQQWDVELIRQNPSKAKKAFAQFFYEESRRPDFEDMSLDANAAHKKSEDFINGLIDSDGEIYGDDVLRRAVGDPFFNRVINLNPEQYNFMDDFLVNDLEGLIAKYFDSTTRKIALTDRLGVAGHGFSAYMNVAKKGVNGAITTLKSSKKVVYRYRQYQEEAPVEQMLVPAIKISEEETGTVLEAVKTMLQEGRGVDEAKRMLLSYYDPIDQADPQLVVRVDAIVNGLKDFPEGNISVNTAKLAEQMMDVMNKRPLVKFSEAEFAYRTSRTVKAFNSITLLAFTTLTSLGDKALPLVRSGNFKAWATANKKWYSDPEYRNAAKSIGTGIENLMHDRMVQMAGEGSQKLQNSFFNFTLLTPWTNMNREIASLVGFEAFKSEIARARKLKASGKELSRSYKTAERFLKRYGMTGEGAEVDFLSPDAPELTDIKSSDMLENKQLRYGLMRFTNEAIFTPNPNDIPLWFQTPWGSMIFQLKSFQLMMARMGKYTIDEWREGNRAPLAYLATAGVGMGWASAAAKDHVQARGGEDGESRELRERRVTGSVFGPLARAIGVEEDSMTDEIAGNYVDGLMAIGGLGLFGELLYNTAEQADNGAFGKLRTFSAVLGPSVGTAEDAYDVFVGGPLGLGEEKAGRRREAVRSIVGRIPVAGGIRSFKEGVVDAVAGEAGSGGKKKKQASKFGSNSFSSNKGFGKEGF